MPELEALYATVDELRSRLGISTAQADDNAAEDSLLDASRWVDDYVNQRKYGFTSSPPGTVETINVRGLGILALPHPLADVDAITELKIGDGVVASTNYVVDSRSVVFLPATWWGQVKVTATWGWSYVPTVVRRATLLYAAALIAEGSDAESTTMRSITTAPESQVTQFKAAASRYMAQAEKLVVRYRRHGIA